MHGENLKLIEIIRTMFLIPVTRITWSTIFNLSKLVEWLN